jgi:NADPH:quinone reductase
LKALVIENGDVQLQERPTPEPESDQILVEVASAGINRADLIQIAGMYPAPPGWPEDVPGLEFAGTVSAVGEEVSELQPGHPVFGIVGGGGLATHLLTKEDLCMRVPESLDLIEAGAIPEVFITAHDALVTQGNLRSGETVLIHAVASGVGTALIQVASALGATTVGTSRTKEKLERVREFGLDRAVEASENMAVEIGDVDLVIDLVGGDYLRVDLEVCNVTGRIVLVGMMGGASAEIDLSCLLRKRLTLRGTTLRARPDEEKAQATRRFAQELLPLFERKTLRPVIEARFGLTEAKDAFELMRSNRTVGKVLLIADE